LVPSNFCKWLSLFAIHCGKLAVLPQTSLLNSRVEGKKSMKGNGRNMSEATTGDGEWTREEKEGIGVHPT